MDPACGPPDAIAEKRDELTPMMAQYEELCRRYDDALVLFQVGDFYEAFCEAAERCARLLEIALTSREDSTGEYPMAGIPIDNAENYIETLLDAGYRVAVADQIEEPGESPGVVERAVTRVVTPGTLTEDELLAGADNTFVASLARSDGNLAVAFLDVSTGDFLTTSSSSEESIADEISRFAPAEAVVGPAASPETIPDDRDCMVTPYERAAFDRERAGKLVERYFGDPDRILGNDTEVRACGALLSYAEYARGGADGGSGNPGTDDDWPSEDEERSRLGYITHVTRYNPREYLLLDAVALRSLELFEPRTVHGREDATLIGVIDETASALGGRKLRDWLRRPLLSPDRIEARLDAVEELSADVRTRESLHEELAAIYDLERLIGRISRGRADARDLQSLRSTLEAVPEIRNSLADVDCDRLRELHGDLDPLADVRELIENAVVIEPPVEITEGGIVAEGYDEDLDELRATAREGKAWIDDLAERERERTGIDSLKVDHSSVHGYYIEVTNPNLDRVPEDYERRQTLKNSERFVTPELRDREDEIVRAEGRADDREYELFCEVRREVASEVERVQDLAEALATVDALVSLATVAARYDYCRPEILEGESVVEIEGGRHPVVERTQESFVPNDARLDEERRLAVITGPNMSGKSTYMRQVACIAVLAQVGSFVPARSARLSPLERIFTRVGASDDIAGGRSTFMIEMEELVTILREADGRSLVLLDEVGRGTSTADGLAIARAIVERLHASSVMTLFATHHHPLTELAAELEGAERLHFKAGEDDGEVVFSHAIEPGAADGSYGIEVAAAAGVPEEVVERSRELVAEAAGPGDDVEPDDSLAAGDATAVATADGGERTPGSRSSSEPRSDVGDVTSVAAELRALDLAYLTPVEALTELDRLKGLLEE